MRERAAPKDYVQRLDPPQRYGELTKRMANRGNCLRSELGNSSVDRSKDILGGATHKLRGRFEADVVIKRTVRGRH